MCKIFLLPVFMLAFAVASWAGLTDMPQETLDPKQAFMAGGVMVKGEGAAPDKPISPAQKRMLALRAAKITALREVAEILNGVAVTGETTVKDAAASSDVVRTSVEGVVTGARVVKEVYDPAAAMAAVYVTLPLQGIAGSLIPLLSGEVAMPPFQPAGAASAMGYDGLIIDARELEMKPALINRIITKGGEAIYDPSKVAREVIASRGAAGYTSGIDEAMSILAARGSKNPLVVKASGVVRGTDVELAPEEAVMVFSANQTGGFFEAARVVFVLN